MESEEPFGDEMPNFDIWGTVFKELFKDIASSENSGRKSTFQLASDFVTLLQCL